LNKEDKIVKKNRVKKILVTSSIFIGIFTLLIIGAHVMSPLPAIGQQQPGPYVMEIPPKSLDKLYPPQAEQPVWLFEMLKLAVLWRTVGNGVQQKDWADAQQGFDDFRAQIIKLSNMVPEWKHHFKLDLVDAVGRALAQKDPKAIGEASRKMGGGICGHCHGEHRVAVWYRYQFKDFSKVMVEDPFAKKKFPLRQFMFMISGPFEDIEIDLKQGQLDNARKAFGAFSARAKALKKACEECHDPEHGERKYFVDSEVMEKIDGLGAELANAAPAHENVEKLFMGIGVEMCYECHLVHVPAATVQNAWRPKTQ
jgi:cytochrome c553